MSELKLIAILALVAGLLFGLRHAINEHDAAVTAAYTLAQEKANEAATLQANKAALRYQDWKIAQQPRVVTITKEVHDAVAVSPVWSVEPIPDGVRSAIAAASEDFAASGSAGAVPVLPAASDNERATSGGLRLGPASVPGLLGAASRSR